MWLLILKSRVIVYVYKKYNKYLKSESFIKLLFRDIYKIGLTDYEILRNSYGKILLKNSKFHLSISHTDNLFVLAVSEKIVGVDLERIRAIDRYILNRAFNVEEIEDIKNSSESEKLFFTLWTLKESQVKALGLGLSYGMKKIAFKVNDNKIISNVEGYYYRSYEIYGNNILAICTKGNVEEIEIKEVDISNEGVCYF